MAWSRDEILMATGGRLVREGKRKRFGEVVTDSSKVKRGSVFVALKGERLDGHRFVGDAVRRGARCVIVHRHLYGSVFKDAAVVKVRDTLRALGELAHYRRETLAPKVLAITGSNGKTTTKEMVAAILERASVDGQRRLGAQFKGRKITYGAGGQVRAESWRSLGAGGMLLNLRAGGRRTRVRLNFLGGHNVANALGAAALAYGLGVSLPAIRRGLQSARPFPMRMQIEEWRGIGIINDAYNANPASMQAAIKTLVEIERRGERVAVLGDMFELGAHARKQHRQLGRRVAEARLDRVYLLGAEADRDDLGAR